MPSCDVTDGVPWVRWSASGRLNLADACVHRWVREARGEDETLRRVGEDGSTAAMTRARLSAAFVDHLPRTRSARIMRRTIHAVLGGDPAGELTKRENPGALEAVRLAR